jgi:uncharacterized membrane protein HdeD (DUF308 family)
MTSATVPATAASDELPWWLGLVQGVALLVLGVLCLTAPGATILVLVQLTGLYWLITGILGLISLVSDRTAWLWKVFASVIGILAGIAVVGHPMWSSILVPTTLVIVIGIFGIVNGILVMVQAWGIRRWSAVILGLVGVLLGLVLVANPLIGAATLPLVLGIFALVGGVMSIVMAWFERRAQRSGGSAVATAAPVAATPVAAEPIAAEPAPVEVAPAPVAEVESAPVPEVEASPAPASAAAPAPASAAAPAPSPVPETADDGGAANGA